MVVKRARVAAKGQEKGKGCDHQGKGNGKGGDVAGATAKGPPELAALPKAAQVEIGGHLDQLEVLSQGPEDAEPAELDEAPRNSATLQQTVPRRAGGLVLGGEQVERIALSSAELGLPVSTQRAAAAPSSQDNPATGASGKRKRGKRDKMSAALDSAAATGGQGRQSNFDKMLGF